MPTLFQELQKASEPQKPTYDFVSQLTESKLVPSTKHLGQWTGRDIADYVFLYLISLEILRHEDPKTAAQYANSAIRYGDFNTFYGAANDLYIFLHILTGQHNQSCLDGLKDHKKSADFLKRIFIDYRVIKNYLRLVATEKYQAADSRQFFLNLEARLKIDNSNYRSMRRLIVAWPAIDHNDRSLVMTRLLQAFRARLNRSELRPPLEQLSRRGSYELGHVANPETGQRAPERKAALSPQDVAGATALGQAIKIIPRK